jgi:hypothetical protein
MGTKAELPLQLRKTSPQTNVDLSPLLSVEATGVCIAIGNTEMLLAAVYKSPQRLWSDIDITKPLGPRNKSVLASAKHPAWKSQVSNPSGLKLSELFVSSTSEISAPQCSTLYTPNGRGNVPY